IENLALSDYVGKSEFCLVVNAPAFSGLRTRTYDIPAQLESINVRVTTIDRQFKRLKRLDCIKIDAEGGEYHILRGAVASLNHHRPAVAFEFGLSAIGEYRISCADMGEFWRERNYLIYDILGRKIETVEHFVESSTRQEVWDYVAIPR